jgi:hypothetical protein
VAFNRDTDAEGDIQIDRFAQLLGLLTGQSRIPGIEE